MKLRKYIIVPLILFLVSCDFGSTNENPGTLTDASLSLILPGAGVQAAYNLGALGGRMPGIVMQQWAGSDAQQLAYTSYNITEIDINNLWVTGLYSGVMKDANVMIEKATKDGNFYYIGIAKILMAQALGLATSFWGDVPYSKAFDIANNPKPEFDSQESIYTSIQQLLDQAITELSKPSYVIPPPPGKDDVYFGGNAAKWVKVAHSLKARYYIHLIKRDPANAQKALDQMAFALASNADEPICPFQSNQNNANPYYLFGIGRPGTMVMAPSFVTTLSNRNDPRKSKFVHTNNTSYFNSGNSNLFWVQATSALPLISFAEIKFIEAEARLRTGDVSGAETSLRAAIVANMNKMNVDGTTYVALRGSFTGLTSTQQQLERIIEEKYVALYAQAANEIWVDYRRTGFPAISPIPNGEAAGLNPGGQIPKRFIYPISERQTNGANLSAAKTRQGGDLLNADLWAFKN